MSQIAKKNVHLRARQETLGSPPLDQELACLLRAFGERMRNHLRSCGQRVGLRPIEMFALQTLQEPLPMGRLAELLAVDASYVTAIADGLEDRGLIFRQVSRTDRRVKELVLTPEGDRIWKGLEACIIQDHPLLRTLGEADKKTLRRLLRKAVGDKHAR